VYVTVHDAFAGPPAGASTHVVELNAPGPLLVNVTVPDGTMGDPVAVSVTTALHDAGSPAGVAVAQSSTVVVERGVGTWA
jgi:hypothetical protein